MASFNITIISIIVKKIFIKAVLIIKINPCADLSVGVMEALLLSSMLGFTR